jgi:O-glycosyl hydrolase
MKTKLPVTIVFIFFALLNRNGILSQPVTFTIDTRKTAQNIDNFGASGAWFTEEIGKYWPAEKKERMAELLFSKAFDSSGQPLGIGISTWRFNAGAGTAEQGDSSGIRTAVKRVECFLTPGGAYDWSKQQGYMWFVKKAVAYGVENLVLFSNSPPVQFTKNGLGFNTVRNFETNLRDDRYSDYAGFLATVVQHFNDEGIHFNYVSPVNEPQWDWSNKFGQMNQEGSPWHNKDIYRIAVKLDSTLSAKKLTSKILLPEAGTLTALYEGTGHASKQIQTFFKPGSLNLGGNLKHLERVVAGHSYFTDNGDSTIISVRDRLKDTALKYNVGYWQSEYSMLGDGYKEGKKDRVPAFDCALFLSKIIYHDLVIGNASAWHLWNSWEPGNAAFDTRYYLLALKNAGTGNGDFTVTKNLWAMGHFSRFIRPGMQRVITTRSDHLSAIDAAKEVMLAAFSNKKQIVVVAINYAQHQKQVALNIPGLKTTKGVRRYLTTANPAENMKPGVIADIDHIVLESRSMVTIVINK